MSCAPMRFLLGAGATAALAGLGYFITGGYGEAVSAEAVGTPEVAAVETTETIVSETPATAEQVASCQTQVDATIQGKVVQFDSGTAVIKAESQPLIDTMAKVLAPCEGTQVEVAGHTDLTGNDAANLRLSEERANAVIAALVAKGVPNARLTPKGYGETKPAMQGTGPAANAANRRIEFAVTAAGAVPATISSTSSTPAPSAGL